MKKLTLGTATVLVALSTLGFAANVNAAELAKTDIPVSITEGTASLAFNDNTAKSLAFDFKNLDLSKGTTLTSPLTVNATLTNLTTKSVTGYIQATANGAGLSVTNSAGAAAILSATAANTATANLAEDLTVNLDAKQVSSTTGYSITLTATDVDPVTVTPV